MMTDAQHRALLGRLDKLARDVGTLRRRFASNEDAWSGSYLADRLASNVEVIAGMVQPSAAEIAACVFPGDDATIDAAIEHVDLRTQRLRRLLRLREAA